MSSLAPGTTPTSAPAAPTSPAAEPPAAAPGAGGGTALPEPPSSVLGNEIVADGILGEPAPAGGPKGGKPGEAGELNIVLPVGTQVNEAEFKEFQTFAQQAGLSSESASKLVEWQLQRENVSMEAQAKAWEDQGAQWAKELVADKDFGGENLDHNVLNAQKGLKRFDPEGVVSAEFKRMGLDNFPPLVKLFSRIGAAMAEDSSGGGGIGPSTGPEADRQAQLRQRYPSMYNEDGSPKT